MFFKNLEMPDPAAALPGRDQPIPVAAKHFVLGTPLDDAFEGKSFAMFGMGCFGAPSASSGRPRACIPPPSDTPRVRR
jgi:hypothetical protein